MEKRPIAHFLYCPFTGLGLHNGYRGDVWLKNRIKIFKHFVLPSLMNQTNMNYVLWISWRPEERTNPIVSEFYKSLEGMRGLTFVFTYEGVCFWDDKYDDEVASYRLAGALTRTLPELKHYVGEAEEVLMTIQPSDDMYAASMVENMQTKWPPHTPDAQVVGYSKGYIIRYATKELAEYNPTTTPPFYTIKFPREAFLSPTGHFTFIGPYKSHEYVKDFLEERINPERGFCVGTHGENISTIFNHPYKGRTIEGKEKEDILMRLGILYSPPLQVSKAGMRLWSRRLLNMLPFQSSLRNLYHSLPAKFKKL